MNPPSRRLFLAILVLSAAASAAAAPPRVAKAPERPSPAPTSAPAREAVTGLEFRSIGPAIMGGRIDDFAVVESRPSTLLRGHRLRRPLEDDQQRHDLRARLRRPGGLVDRRRRAGALRPVRSSTSAPASRTTASRRRGATASTSRSTAARPGPTSASRTRTTSAASSCTRRTRTSSTSPPSATCGDRTRSAASSRPPTAARPGRTRSSSTRTPASWTWPWTRRARTPCTPRPTSGGARPSATTAAGPGSGLWKTTDGGGDLDEAHEGLPDRGRPRPHRHRRLPPRSAHRLRARRAREGGRHLPLRGQGRDLEEDVGHQPAPVATTARSTWTRTTTSASGCWARPCSTPRTAARPSAQDLVPEDPRRLPRALDRSRRLQPHAGRARTAASTSPTTAAAPGTTSTPCPLAQFYEVASTCRSRTASAAACRTTAAGAGPAARSTSRASRTRTGPAWAAATASTYVIDPSDPERRLRGEPGRQRAALDLRTNERRMHPPRAARGRAVPLQLELADPDLAARLRRPIYYGGNRLFGSKDRGETWTAGDARTSPAAPSATR